jgi:hypothetical protein
MAPQGFRRLDLATIGGFLLVLAALPLPWRQVRSCSLADSCSGWQAASSGWQQFGWYVVVLVALAACSLLLPRPRMRRAAALAGSVLLGVALFYYAAWASFVIFARMRFLAGAWLAFAGTLLAIAGALGSLSTDGLPRPAGESGD